MSKQKCKFDQYTYDRGRKALCEKLNFELIYETESSRTMYNVCHAAFLMAACKEDEDVFFELKQYYMKLWTDELKRVLGPKFPAYEKEALA